ncbi:pseudouridine synthase [Tabrizicola oligotrophica]|uniref:Pseudouridine synthase n=1 Tax=Tabrizicola oligotrophica TaxID=2710650 RepID=A0A6M0QTQ9_9RHOB|nr:pseudouridine synthase [Tabrizicola oligotrophica]
MAEKENPTPEGERIAKVLSRRGVASRREAERLIEAGEVTVNGKIITSPALNVTEADRITISGHPLPALEPARLWLYYKPDGLVTSASDEKGRDTVFDHLPEDMPRVMSVGRLDLNSEGLLLLTNDGELKRRLELPSTGWLRKYRVRVNGNPTDPDLEPLRKGITIEGEKFQPMSVVLDRHQGANAWLTVGLREGKNREIRRAMAAIELTVNRLIRVSYGPFRLGELKPGEVEEVRQKTLREQLGEGGGKDAPDPAARKPRAPTTRRLRPGDAVKALAKAWDEANAPQKTAVARTGAEGRSPRPRDTAPSDKPATAPRDAARAGTEGRSPRSRDTAPSDKPATAPRDAARASRAVAEGRSPKPRGTAPFGKSAAAARDEARAPRAGNEERGSATPRKPTAPRTGAPAPRPGPDERSPRPRAGGGGRGSGKPPARPRKG